jgi:hypothetical protein
MNVDMIYEKAESLGIHLGYELDKQSLEDLIILYFWGFSLVLVPPSKFPCCLLLWVETSSFRRATTRLAAKLSALLNGKKQGI